MDVRPEGLWNDLLGQTLHGAQEPPHTGILRETRHSHLRVQYHPMNREGLESLHRSDPEMRRRQPRQEGHRRAQLPPLFGCRQRVQGDQRVIPTGLQHIQTTAGGEHARTLREAALGLVEVVNHVAHEHVIEGAIGERDGVSGALLEATRRHGFPGEADLLSKEIDAHGAHRPEVNERRPLPRAHVEHALTEREKCAADQVALPLRDQRRLGLEAEMRRIGGPEGAFGVAGEGASGLGTIGHFIGRVTRARGARHEGREARVRSRARPQVMSSPRRLRVALFAAPLALAAALGGYFVVDRARTPAVELAAVRRSELVQKLVVSGRVMTPARVTVASLIAGRVARVGPSEGEHVAAGAELVALEDRELQVALQQARAAAAQANARLAQLRKVSAPLAREAHAQADANLAAAERSYERGAALLASGATTQALVDEARRALDVARSQHDATEAQATAAGPRGADEQLALAGCAQSTASVAAAEVRLEQARVTASAPGVVLARTVEPGEIVQPGKGLLTLALEGPTQIVIQPDEKGLGSLREGLTAQIAADAFPGQPFSARVSYIAPSIDPQRGTVEVRLTVDSPPPFLRPDMTVSVDIEVGRRADAVVVPLEAISDPSTPNPAAWVFAGGHVERREVKLGLRGTGLVEISEGLGEGDMVVLTSNKPLTPGAAVRSTSPEE